MYIKLTIALCIIWSTSIAQVTDLGGPLSWKGQLDPQLEATSAIVPVHVQTSFSIKAVQNEDAIRDKAKDAPWRFGYKYETNYSFNDGSWMEMGNGDRIWRTEIVCPQALSVNLLFKDLNIPDGAHIYLYDKNESNRVGAYTSRNNRDDGLLGTELVLGDHIVVEYYEPFEVRDKGSLTISHVIHGYRSLNKIQNNLTKALNSSGNCQFDVNCPIGNGWEDQIRSVAMVVVGGNGICTGALINNTCEDGRPLFLSANHCLSTSASLWTFRFNWSSPPGTESCATTALSVDPGMPYDESANGATLLASGIEADHALMEIDNMTLADAINWNLYYSGWNHNDNSSPTEATCIHHPSGDVMKISQETDSPYHSFAASASVWWVDSWENGTTEGGSSGAPLFDQDRRIIGQLYGGTAGCAGTNNNGGHDYFGRLGVSWDYGLSDHLAPASCGQTLALDGYDPSAASTNDDASIQFIESPNGDICGVFFEPSLILRNAGDNNLTSCTIHYDIDGLNTGSIAWTGNLVPNASETVTLNIASSTAGPHVYNAWTSDPNGVVDSDQGNDSTISNFVINPNTVTTFINVITDCYGYENAWEIHDITSTLVASGGNPSVPPGGAQTAMSSDPYSYGNVSTIRERICLAEGCYDFTMYDDWGDGMEGTTQFNCDFDGDYNITNSSNTTLGSMQNVAFGVSETINFCVVQDAGLNEIDAMSVAVYPNPSSGIINIEFEGSLQDEVNINIVDITGRVLSNQKVTKTAFSLDLSSYSNGSYFIEISNANSAITKKLVVSH